MLLTFDQAVQKVIERNEINSFHQEIFINDSNVIAEAIFERMKKTNSMFLDVFKNLETVATFHKGPKLFDLPNNFNLILTHKLPFMITSMAYLDKFLAHIYTNVTHPLVKNGCVCPDAFELLFKQNLEDIINKMENIPCEDDRIYKLVYHTKEGKFRYHCIEAIEQSESVFQEKIRIEYSFILALIFPEVQNLHPDICRLFNSIQFWFACKTHSGFGALHTTSVWFIYPHVMLQLSLYDRIRAKNIMRLVNTVCVQSDEYNHQLDPREVYLKLLVNKWLRYKKLPLHRILIEYVKMFAKEIEQDMLVNGHFLILHKEFKERLPITKLIKSLKEYFLKDAVELTELMDLLEIG